MATKVWQGDKTITTETWNNPENWSTGEVPVDGDDVVIDDDRILSGIDQHALILNSLKIRPRPPMPDTI